MSVYDIYPYWDEQGLSGLEGVIGHVATGPGGRVGFVDTFGNFYYFTSPANEARFSQSIGQQIDVAEDAISRTDPGVPVAGQLPWTLPGVGAPSSNNHKWRNIDLFAGVGLAALLLGSNLLGGSGKKTGSSSTASYNGGGSSNVIEA